MSYEKWLAQAEHDLQAAEVVKNAEHHEWACFLALQAAEKAQKAYFYALGMEPPFRRGADGHDLIKLANAWPKSVVVMRPEVARAQTNLNRYGEDTRYPHFDKGQTQVLAPYEDYNQEDSTQALSDAKMVVRVCRTLAFQANEFAITLGKYLSKHLLNDD